MRITGGTKSFSKKGEGDSMRWSGCCLSSCGPKTRAFPPFQTAFFRFNTSASAFRSDPLAFDVCPLCSSMRQNPRTPALRVFDGFRGGSPPSSLDFPNRQCYKLSECDHVECSRAMPNTTGGIRHTKANVNDQPLTRVCVNLIDPPRDYFGCHLLCASYHS